MLEDKLIILICLILIIVCSGIVGVTLLISVEKGIDVDLIFVEEEEKHEEL